MSDKSNREIQDKIHQGVTEGVRKAVAEHKRAGRSIHVWRDGKVVEILPQDIVVAER